MVKFVDEMAKCGGISAKFGEIWQGTGKILRNLVEQFSKIWQKNAEFSQNLAENNEIWRNLAKKGKIWRHILKMKKLRNVGKFEKNDEV